MRCPPFSSRLPRSIDRVQLVAAGFLRSEKQGRWVHYHLIQAPASSEVASLLPLLRFWMNEEAQVKADRIKLKAVCKEGLCAK